MTKRPKPKRKTGKSGRPAEHLKIAGDPQAALDQILGIKRAMNQEWDRAHPPKKPTTKTR